MKKKSPSLAIVFSFVSIFIFLILIEAFFQLNFHWNIIKKPPRPLTYEKIKRQPVPNELQKQLQTLWPDSIFIPTPSPLDKKIDYSKKYNWDQIHRENGNSDAFFIFKPNIKTRSVIQFDHSKQVVYDLWYQTDISGRRKVINQKKGASEHLLFLGGSMTWGDGVQGDKIFPFHVQEAVDSHQVYINARSSFGPNDLLDLIKKEGWAFKYIKQRKGIAFYVFIDDHINRAFATLQGFRDRPYLVLRSNYQNVQGQIVDRGMFKNSPFYLGLYALSKSKFLDFFNIDYPLNYEKKSIQLTLDLILEVEKELKNKLGTKELVLLFYKKGRRGKELEKSWNDLGKRSFDYSNYDFQKATKNKHKFPLDGHPTELTHWLLSQLMLADFKALNINVQTSKQ